MCAYNTNTHGHAYLHINTGYFNFIQFHIGIVALVNGNKNMGSTIEAAYEAIIPAFESFETANVPKVCHMWLQLYCNSMLCTY